MATVTRPCDECGQPYAAQRKTSKFCSTRCRTRACRRTAREGKALAAGAKPAANVVQIEQKGAADQAPPDRPTYDTLEEQVRQSLNGLQALDTISGMAAVRIAQQIDRGGDSGSAVSTLTKELSRLVGEAKVEAAPRHRDGVTSLEERVTAKIYELAQ